MLNKCYCHEDENDETFNVNKKTREASDAGAQERDCEHYRTWVRFPLEEIKYLIFLFLRSGVEAKNGVVFHHSTRSALVENNLNGNRIS